MLPRFVVPYAELMRLEQPTGLYLFTFRICSDFCLRRAPPNHLFYLSLYLRLALKSLLAPSLCVGLLVRGTTYMTERRIAS